MADGKLRDIHLYTSSRITLIVHGAADSVFRIEGNFARPSRAKSYAILLVVYGADGVHRTDARLLGHRHNKQGRKTW